MSQWGAFGMATQGETAQQILDFYYPGTPDDGGHRHPTIKVWLKRANAGEVDIVAARGSADGDRQRHRHRARVAGRRRRRAGHRLEGGESRHRPDRALGLLVERLASVSGGRAAQRRPATSTFASDSGVVRLVYPDTSERDYQGTIGAVPNGTDAARRQHARARRLPQGRRAARVDQLVAGRRVAGASRRRPHATPTCASAPARTTSATTRSARCTPASPASTPPATRSPP